MRVLVRNFSSVCLPPWRKDSLLHRQLWSIRQMGTAVMTPWLLSHHWQILAVLEICASLLRAEDPVLREHKPTFAQEFTCQCRRCKTLSSIPGSGRSPQRRKWQPTPVFLPGEFSGQRSLAGYSPQGGKESDTTERLCTTYIREGRRKTEQRNNPRLQNKGISPASNPERAQILGEKQLVLKIVGLPWRFSG